MVYKNVNTYLTISVSSAVGVIWSESHEEFAVRPDARLLADHRHLNQAQLFSSNTSLVETPANHLKITKNLIKESK